MPVTYIPLKFIFGMNCYLIQSDSGFYLIDTGIKKLRKQLEKTLSEAGCKHGDLKLIILTHGHIDHIGNAAYLREKYDAKIAIHIGDVNMVTGGGMFADAPQSMMIKIMGFFMNLTGLSDFETFTPDILLDDNQSLKEHGLDATVLYTPGHSKGSISIYTADEDLFCGDIFSGSMEAVTTLVDDQTFLDKSVKQLKTLNIKTVYPGHGEPFNR